MKVPARQKHRKNRPRRTQAERRAATREAFLEAAWSVFLRRGFAAASVEEISAEAGYTRGAFYYNFASRNDLFVSLLQDRVYSTYRQMAEARLRQGEADIRGDASAMGSLQAGPEAGRLFRLWLELLAAAGRDEELRRLAAGFWSGNRELVARLIEEDYRARDKVPPIAPEKLATAVIALDVGLAVQHHVDPGAAPLELYPELFELLFGAIR